MRWVVEPQCRADLVFYSGFNCSGREAAVRIFPTGSKGEIAFPFQSMKVFAPPGVRVYLCTTSDDAWQAQPWRCIRVTEDVGLKVGQRMRMLRIHDLDLYNDPKLLAMPPGDEVSITFVQKPEDGDGWTFGRGSGPKGNGVGALKGNVRQIRVLREDHGSDVADVLGEAMPEPEAVKKKEPKARRGDPGAVAPGAGRKS